MRARGIDQPTLRTGGDITASDQRCHVNASVSGEFDLLTESSMCNLLRELSFGGSEARVTEKFNDLQYYRCEIEETNEGNTSHTKTRLKDDFRCHVFD